MSIAVVYIARGIDAGLPAVEAFLKSYKKFNSGIEHTLYIAAKGWTDDSSFIKLKELCDPVNCELIMVDDDGFDWGAYIRVSSKLDEQWVCFLNSHSRLRAKNWLAIMFAEINRPNVGLVGATGSWSTWVFKNPFWTLNLICVLQYPIRLFLQLYKHYKYRKKYNFFPNFHLRSNAFLIEKSLFSEFCKTIKIPTSKAEAHILESGRQGLSKFVQEKDLELRVCNSNSLSYKPSEWIHSETFRTPGQSKLLVEDNQTCNYDSAGRYLKQRLEYASWGRYFS